MLLTHDHLNLTSETALIQCLRQNSHLINVNPFVLFVITVFACVVRYWSQKVLVVPLMVTLRAKHEVLIFAIEARMVSTLSTQLRFVRSVCRQL